MFHVVYTPYTSSPQFEICWNNTPIAQHDASQFSEPHAQGIVDMLNDKLRTGEQINPRYWRIVGMSNLPRTERVRFRNLFTSPINLGDVNYG